MVMCQEMGDEVGDPQSLLSSGWQKVRELICIEHLLSARSFHMLSYELLECTEVTLCPLQMRRLSFREG